MSVVSKAEVALINSLQKSRSSFQASGRSKIPGKSPGKAGETGLPPIPAISEEEEELRNVLTLEVPRFDKNKTFKSLEKQKISKKDRHMTALDEYSQFLDKLSEDIERRVLDLSREVREMLENIDESLQKWYKDLVSDGFLVVKSEDEVAQLRTEIESILSKRNATLDLFANNLENLEVDRASTVSSEIKKLLDKLIAVAFQLPNEIEYTIETEAFELNAVVTSNRKTHATLLGIMRTSQVEVEVEAIHRWEVAKKRWRVLRHEQAIAQYHEHMKSDRYTDPGDRQRFLRDFRQGQLQRHTRRSSLLEKLAVLNAADITTAAVVAVQEQLAALSEEESQEMQRCYDGLTALRSELKSKAENRREELRLELHQYGALEDEPPLRNLSDDLKRALADEKLSELWRLGGGLKPEFVSLSADLSTDQIIYDSHTSNARSRLDTIVVSFGLKEILNERGRLMRLEPIRGMITKMKSVPRKEVINVVRDLMPDLEEIVGVEKVPALFRSTVQECMQDMEREMARVEDFIKTSGENSSAASGSRGMTRGTSRLSNAANTVKVMTTLSRAASKSGTKTRLTAATTAGGVDSEYERNSTINPLSVKNWTRQLGILYYGSNLPDEYQTTCQLALEGAEKQLRCNALVDKVIQKECTHVIDKIDQKYKKLIDQLANYLEMQVSMLSLCCSNIVELYSSLAQQMESHRASQKEIDDKAADSLWDYSEDYRLLREDLESAYEEACKLLRQSADYDTLGDNFEKVLKTLSDIQDSYRLYHEKACFLADMHPLNLANRYKDHLEKLCTVFDLHPIPPHPILHTQGRILQTVKRLNKKYYVDPNVSVIPAQSSDAEIADTKDTVETSRPATSSGSRPNSAAPQVAKETVKDEDLDSPRAPAIIKDFPGGIYISPLFENPEEIITHGAVIGSSSTKIGGKYGLNTPMPQFVASMFEDANVREERQKRQEQIRLEEIEEKKAIEKANRAVVPMAESPSLPVAETKPAAKGKGPSAAELAAQKAAADAQRAAEAERLADEAKVATMKGFPWLLADGAEEFGNSPLPSQQEFDAWDQFDREEREDLIAKYMIHIKDGSANPAVLADPEGLGVLYSRCEAARKRSIDRRRYNGDPEFILNNIPTDVHGRPWLEKIEVYQDGIVKVLTGFRNSLVTHLENEAYYKTVTTEELNKARKSTLTEELEDRLRTHWPRRGRVETQLKQPREAELLSHQEKTWRIIQSIQEKMLKLQNNFQSALTSGQDAVKKYVEDMDELKVTLQSTTYKTLASLQGMDVKGRSTSLTFQSECVVHTSGLNKIVNEDVKSTIDNAQDFRKLCPLQKMGLDGVPTGGYSEDEINHIQSLVDSQEQEIQELSVEWKQEISRLQEVQDEALKKQEEFATIYNSVAQELALSEGLGQRYGAPRRRAQERLRTEQARDEQSAGKIDELLAKLDFELNEGRRRFDTMHTNKSMTTETGSSIEEKQFGPDKNGRIELDHINYVWSIVSALRSSLDQRALYLQVYPEGKRPDTSEIPWISPDLIPSVTDPADSSNQAVASIPSAPISFSVIVDEAEADCKKETVQLYESEGRGATIKNLPGGVPESLTIWLQETRQKLLGPGGHREKSWKRLWRQ